MCLSAGEYTLLDSPFPADVILPVVREQGIAYVLGGIFAKKPDFGASAEASLSQPVP